jgi:REP element-mobilizing transposase RayT
MRHLRILKPDVWYEIYTAINNREHLFRFRCALALFDKVLDEAKKRFAFEIRGLYLAGDLLTFFIRPEDGLELPGIMKWIKQTFAVRYNLLTGRTGHIWGDRYWSVILEGEPAEVAGYETETGPRARRGGGGVRPRSVEMVIITGFPPYHPLTTPLNSGNPHSRHFFPPPYPLPGSA